jgi:hypothetical protein
MVAAGGHRWAVTARAVAVMAGTAGADGHTQDRQRLLPGLVHRLIAELS